MKQWIVDINDVLAKKEAAKQEQASPPPDPPEPPQSSAESTPPQEETAAQTPPQTPEEPSPEPIPFDALQEKELQPEEPLSSDESAETDAGPVVQEETPSAPAAPSPIDIPLDGELPPPEGEPSDTESDGASSEMPADASPSPSEEEDDAVDLDAPLPDPGHAVPHDPPPPRPAFWSRFEAQREAIERHPIRTLVVVIFLVLAGIFIFLQQQGKLDGLIRWYHYSNVTGEQSFEHNNQRLGVFVGHERKLIVCSETQIQVFSPTGENYLTENVTMTSPTVSTAKGGFVAYDAGGRELRVVKDDKVALALTLETGKTILSASLNDAGWLAVTTKEDGYKGVVTVYNEDKEPKAKMTIRLSSRYLTDAVITPDCTGVYAVSPGQKDGAFESSLLYFSIPNPTTDTPIAQVSLGNSIVLNTRCTNNTCWVLGENWLSFLSNKGELSEQYDYNGRYLKKGSLQGDGFAALLLSNSQSSSSGTLCTVNRKGEEIAQVDISEPVTTLAASGNYVAILTSNHLYLYNKDLELLSESSDVLGYSSIVLFEDGSMNLVSDKKVNLYLPK